MNEPKKTVRVFREMKWEPGQEEHAKARAARIEKSGLSREQLIESGVIAESVPWGELLETLVLARELKAARLALKLTLIDLEKLTGINHGQLSRFENGQTNPTMQTITRYANAIGKQFRFVLEDLSPQENPSASQPALSH